MMKIDLYTKVLLTIIAASLLLLTANQLQLFPTVHASDTSTSFSLPNYGLVPLNEDGSVKISMETMDVRIVDINTYDVLAVSIKDIDTYETLPIELKKISCNDELDVNIDEIGGSYISMGGPIPVKIKP